jgi:hypothetical protein
MRYTSYANSIIKIKMKKGPHRVIVAIHTLLDFPVVTTVAPLLSALLLVYLQYMWGGGGESGTVCKFLQGSKIEEECPSLSSLM